MRNPRQPVCDPCTIVAKCFQRKDSKSGFMALLELLNMLSESMAEIKAPRGKPGMRQRFGIDADD